MYRLHPLLRKILLVMLVPLIFFNGRVSAGCICKDGHFKLFCDGHGYCAEKSDRHESDNDENGDCCKQPRSCSVEADHSCCSHSKKDGVDSDTGGHRKKCSSQYGCHKLPLAPMKLTEKDFGTVTNEFFVLEYVFCSEWSLSIGVSVLSHPIIFLPPRERQKLLQRFVI